MHFPLLMLLLLLLLLALTIGPAVCELSLHTQDIIDSHKFLFVIGEHHSGTSLLKLLLGVNRDVSGLEHTHRPEDEGSHIQTVYPDTLELGGQYRYGFDPAAYLNESSPLINDTNRERLVSEWAPFWNLTKHVLEEKSPRHITMTRFLQAMFGAERSYFLVVLRHPLGTVHEHFLSSRQQHYCAGPIIEHWLTIHRHLLDDLPHLQNVVLMHYEEFVEGDTQAIYDAILDKFGLPAQRVQIISASDTPPAHHRRLLEYNGPRTNITVTKGKEYSWVEHWAEVARNNTDVCGAVINKHESEVAHFGYSLIGLKKFIVSPALKPYYVTLPAADHRQ